MDGMNIVLARVGDPAVVFALCVKRRGIKFVDFVMGLDITQLKIAPEGIDA